MTPTSMTPTSLRIIGGLALGLGVWGAYLAVGAALYNQDATKGVIIFGCAAAFVLFWFGALFAGRSRPLPAKAGDWNRSSLTAIALALVAQAILIALWNGAVGGPWRTSCLLISQLLLGSAAIAALMGLSHPRRKRGQWLGGLALVVVCFAVWTGFQLS